jgi:insulysin
MKLVIYGKNPVDELESWTKELFSNIENKDIEAPSYKELPYAKENTGKIIRFVPFKDEDYLELYWFIDNLEPHYMNCPGSYISHLIGHEGKNSLLSVLIDEGLA